MNTPDQEPIRGERQPAACHSCQERYRTNRKELAGALWHLLGIEVSRALFRWRMGSLTRVLLLMWFARTHGPPVTHAKIHLGISTLSARGRRVSEDTVPAPFRYVMYSFSTPTL